MNLEQKQKIFIAFKRYLYINKNSDISFRRIDENEDCVEFSFEWDTESYVESTFEELAKDPNEISTVKWIKNMFDYYKIPILKINVDYKITDWGAFGRIKFYIDINNTNDDALNKGQIMLGYNFLI